MPNLNNRDDLSDMITGIARRVSSKLYSRSTEDIVQDLWVKVLETEKRKGHELDLPLAAKVCYDYVNDMIDYDQRRNHLSYDSTVLDAQEDDESGDMSYLGTSSEDGRDFTDTAMINDLFNKFPKGSKERIFLDFWGNESGVHPNSDAIPPKTRKNDGYTEDNLARMLGYSGHDNGSYKKFRDKMKKYIADYFKTESIKLIEMYLGRN